MVGEVWYKSRVTYNIRTVSSPHVISRRSETECTRPRATEEVVRSAGKYNQFVIAYQLRHPNSSWRLTWQSVYDSRSAVSHSMSDV
uniref:Uncharacterized protein n=1 Tax=Pristionchus pacificus TaxID=54126 RepID=A0A2A6BA68_PRIPA|eukprot:PDM62763.1 hypothetical protein PRIPAC_49978 [Pristionchus pacificus]